MKSLIIKGEIYTFEILERFYYYSRKENSVFEITEEQYNYLNQKNDIFIENENFDKFFKKNSDEGIIPTYIKDLIINVDLNDKANFPLIIKEILNCYNKYNRVIINFEANYATLHFIENILQWVNGYDRIFLSIRLNSESSDLINNFRIYLGGLSKKYSFKILLEYYYNVFQLEEDFNLKKISLKIHPILSSNKLKKEEIDKLCYLLLNSKKIAEFKESFELSKKIRPVDIISITDNEIIYSNNSLNNNCNVCWAKEACFSNNLYKSFSLHPYVNSINKQNCTVIKEAISKSIIDSLNKIIIQKEVKFKNKIIIINSNILTHLNP